MFRHIVACLAKKRVTPPAHRKPLRRGASTGTGGRAASAGRRPNGRSVSSRRLTVKMTSAGASGGATAARRQGAASTALAVSRPAADVAPAAANEVSQIPQVVDIVSSRPSYRLATAVSTVLVPPAANAALEGMKQILTPAVQRRADMGLGAAGSANAGPVTQMEEYYTSKKGPLFATAVIAGTSAVKQASTMIPFCHPTSIHKCSFTFRRRLIPQHALRPSALPHQVVLRKRSSPPSPVPDKAEYSVLYCFCTVATEDFKSGVEMEALTGATMASITLYDMLKTLPGAQEDGLALGEAFILAKRGGKSDFIKLLVSEPDRPAAAAAMMTGSAVPALGSSEDSLTSGAAEASSSSGGAASAGAHAKTNAKKSQHSHEEADSAEQGDDDNDDDDDTQDAAPATSLTRRGSGKTVHVKAGASQAMDEDAAEAGDAGAWWRTSKHERRLHEQFPRRKYGEGARLTTPAVPAAKAKAAATEPPSASKRAAAKRKAEEAADEAEDDEQQPLAEEDEEAEDSTPARKTSAPSRSDAKKKTLSKAAARRAAAEEMDDEEAIADEDADDDDDSDTQNAEEQEEEEEVVAVPVRKTNSKSAGHGKGGRQHTAATAGGRGSKTSRYREDEDEDVETVTAPAKAKGKKGAKAPPARRGSHSEVDEDEADDDTHEEEEEDTEVEPVRAKVSKSSTAAKRATKKLATGNHVSRNIRRGKTTDANDEPGEDDAFHDVNHNWGSETVVERKRGDDADDEDEDDVPVRTAAAAPKKKKVLKKKKRGTR